MTAIAPIEIDREMESPDDIEKTSIQCKLDQILTEIKEDDVHKKDIPDVIRYVKKLVKCIELQQVKMDEMCRELAQYKEKVKPPCFSDTSTQTQSADHLEGSSWCLNANTSTLVEQVTKAAESAMGKTGFAYEETSGLYYDYNSGYYYNAELGLYYDGNTGEYYFYDAESQTFKYHIYQNSHERSQTNPCQNVNRLENNNNETEYTSEPPDVCPASQDEERSLKRKNATENGYERPDTDFSSGSPDEEVILNRKNATENRYERPDTDFSSGSPDEAVVLTRKNSTENRYERLDKDYNPESPVEEVVLTRKNATENGYERLDTDFSSDSPDEEVVLNRKNATENGFERPDTDFSPDSPDEEVVLTRSHLNGEGLNHEHQGFVNISTKRKDEDDDYALKGVKRRKHADSDAESDNESREDGECSDTDSREETMDSCIRFECPPASPEPESWPPCIRIIIKESTVPELKIGSLFIITCFGGSIGRDCNNDIILADVLVSKCHAQFAYSKVENKYYITDCGSRNGSFLNGRRMSDTLEKSEPFEVIHGSVLKVGLTQLLCHIHNGTNTCGHCEPGLVQRYTSPALEPKPVYSSKKEYQKECSRLRRRFGLEKTEVIIPSGYEDRAQIRRSTVGSHSEHEKTYSASIDEPIAPDNKGYNLLKRLGWSEGEVLGRDGTGCSEPVKLVCNAGKSGLGSKPTQLSVNIDPVLSKKIELWQKIQKRFEELK